MTALTSGIRVNTPHDLPAPHDKASWHFAYSAQTGGRYLLVSNGAQPATLEIDDTMVSIHDSGETIGAAATGDLVAKARTKLFEPAYGRR